MILPQEIPHSLPLRASKRKLISLSLGTWRELKNSTLAKSRFGMSYNDLIVELLSFYNQHQHK